MSALTDDARAQLQQALDQLVETQDESALDVPFRIAQLQLQLAQVEALERIADKLDHLTDDDAGQLLRIEVVPR